MTNDEKKAGTNDNTILLETEGSIVWLTVNRPAALNALNTSTLLQLEKATEELEERLLRGEDLRCVIVTGAGEKAFVAGADIAEMSSMNLQEARVFGSVSNRAVRKLENLSIPVIAALNGYTLGGGFELALACDIRIASEKALIAFPETGLGITPGTGGTQRLSRLAGPAVAKEMIFTGRRINAEEALALGIVNKVVAAEELRAAALAMAQAIAKNAPIALRAAKQAISRGLQTDIDTGLSYEIEVFCQCFSTEDQKEAMRAFLEKRRDTVFHNK